MTAYITQNSTSSFIAHTAHGDVACANLATARSYVEGTNEYSRVQALKAHDERYGRTHDAVYPVVAYQAPSGQYYAVVELTAPEHCGVQSTFDIRINCTYHTLRTWMKKGVTESTVIDALKDQRNIRGRGGWAAE